MAFVCCPLVFEFSVGIGGFVIGLGQISFFFSVLTFCSCFDLLDVVQAFLISILKIFKELQNRVTDFASFGKRFGSSLCHTWNFLSKVHYTFKNM